MKRACLLILSNITIKLDLDCHVLTWEFPRIKVQPVIWNLHLISIDDLLLEDAVSVSKSVSPGWVIQCCKTVEEACSKPSKTAVAESSIMFLRDDVLNPEAKLGKSLYTSSI
jgi:hypothetical protein